MELKRRTFLGATALTVGFAGCLGGSGGSNSGVTTTTTETSPPTDTSTTTGAATTTAATESPRTTAGTAGTTGPTVQVFSHPDLGDILVGPDQLTLYMFESDTEGESMSTCYNGCAETWPPLTVTGEPATGDEVTAQLATFERETGETQVMAGGWPLYYFAPDEQPGDATGQGVNDVWWVLSPDGTPIKATATTTTDGNSTPAGGGGYP
jgi:predicted lipoprotein with Yx(FWY)xxD motif